MPAQRLRRNHWRRHTRSFALLAGAFALAIAAIAAPAGAATRTYSSGNLSKTIPAATNGGDSPGGLLTTINVPDKGHVKDVDAKVRLNYPTSAIDHLYAYLFSPQGKFVAMNEGSTNAPNMGSGSNSCSGTPTTFNDEATTPIGSAAAPYAGSFKPFQPLSKMDGQKVKGAWSLFIEGYETASGKLGCWKLKIKR